MTTKKLQSPHIDEVELTYEDRSGDRLSRYTDVGHVDEQIAGTIVEVFDDELRSATLRAQAIIRSVGGDAPQPRQKGPVEVDPVGGRG